MRQLKITNRITSRESVSLEKYLQEISKIPMLRPEDETILAMRIKQGDTVALNRLINANLRFVVSVAKQYQNQGLTLSDLINEGNVGLMKACKRFDETKGFKFISYAVWWIRQAILQAIVEYSRIVRVPLNKVSSYHKVNDAYLEFVQKNEREPSNEELAEILEISEKEVLEMLKGNTRHISMDAPLGNDDNEGSMLDTLVDTEEQPDVPLLRESLREDILEGMQMLDRREQQVIIEFFGLGNTRIYSLEEIADRYNLTRERVRQIKERAIRRLRRSCTGSALRSHLG